MDQAPVSGRERERVEGCWLVLDYPDNPTIRLDARLLDRVLVADEDIVLTVDEVTVALRIADGANAARYISERLAPYTRSAPISQPDVYEDAKRRLEAAISQQNERLATTSRAALLFGDQVVSASDDILYVGDFACLISDVKSYASVSAALPLPGGAMQAALGLLIVAARQRRDDPSALAKRIAEYEARRGTMETGGDHGKPGQGR